MSVRLLLLLAISGLGVVLGCATFSHQPAPNELVDGVRCTIRVWDRNNPNDAANRIDYWGTVASADAEKIELIEASTEATAGKPLLEDPKQLPPAVWVRRMRERGTSKFTLRRDQILSIDVLDPRRLKQAMSSYISGTRCNIRTCDTANPHDPAGYRDVWGAVARAGEGGVELTDAREEPAVILPPPGSIRLLTDEVRAAHQKSTGSGKFKIAAERIISIEFLEQRPAKPHAASTGWVRETLF
jgi:hypothetical protein